MHKRELILNGNQEREITYCYFNFNFNLLFKWRLLHFTINVRKSHRQRERNSHLMCKDLVLFVSAVDVRVSSCGAAVSKLRASNSSPVSTLLISTSLFIQHHKQQSTELKSGDSNISMSVTMQNKIRINMNLLSHNYHCCYVLEYLHFLLNHSVYYCRSCRVMTKNLTVHIGFTRQYKCFWRKPHLTPQHMDSTIVLIISSQESRGDCEIIRHSGPAVSLHCSQNTLEIITFATVLIKTDSNVLVFLN
jgi:hypothetical protein